MCYSCPAGTFSDLAGLDSVEKCQKCPPGTASRPGYTACITCPPGTILPELSTFRVVPLVCEQCDRNQFTATPNSLACSSCRAGTYSSPGATMCKNTVCSKGFEPLFGENQCRPCQFGRFSKSGQACQSCPRGFVGNNQNEATRCVPCTSRTFERFGLCQPCPSNHNTGVRGAQICVPDGFKCPTAFFRSRKGGCKQCTTRQRYDASTSKCITCSKNKFSDGGLDPVCRKCPKNSVAERFVFDGKSIVQCNCKPGFEKIDKKCVKCPIGSYSNESTFGCERCNFKGGFSRKVASKRCKLCPLFRVPNEAGTACRNCPAGLRRGPDQGDGCVVPQTNCPPDLLRVSDDSDEDGRIVTCEPASCPVEKREEFISDTFVAVYRICTDCSAGYFFRKSREECERCRDNQISSGAINDMCMTCPAPLLPFPQDRTKCGCVSTRSNSMGIVNGMCRVCPPGTSGIFPDSFGDAKFECTSCPAGQFQDEPGEYECKNCPAGTFTDTEGSAGCKACPDGTISIGIGESVCAGRL